MDRRRPHRGIVSARSRMGGQRRINPAFGGGGGLFAAEKSMDKLFKDARKTGILKLTGKKLVEIPKAVFGLSEQQNLESEEKWWECVELTAVDFSNNCLTSVPREIGNLGDLKRVTLSYNEIKQVPAELGNLECLKCLRLDHNRLTEISEKVFRRPDSSIVELWLQHNALTSLPDSICDLGGTLKILDLSYNKLRYLPKEIELLANIGTFKLSNNALRQIPPGISRLTQLSTLELACNKLEDIPDLSQTRICQLDVHQNNLTHIPKLPSTVTELQLSNNRLKNVDGIEDVKSLIVLNVSDNMLSTLSPRLASLGLKVLNVSNNNLSRIPGEIGLIDSLNILNLNGNPLRAFKKSLLSAPTETVKKYLRTRITTTSSKGIVVDGAYEDNFEREEKSDKMRHTLRDGQASGALSFKGQKLSQIPCSYQDLQKLTNVKTLDLSQNNFSELPKDFFYFPCFDTLHALSLEQNKFRCVPPAVDKLRDLAELNLRKNHISVFPSHPSFVGLVYLDMRNNSLQTFPNGIQKLSKLRTCLLGMNEIRRLPNLAQDGLMAELETLDLSNNKLEIIDDGLCELPRLQNLNIENNNLRRIPLELGVCKNLKSLLVSGNQFRMLKYSVIQKGTTAIIDFIKNKIPLDSPLLQEKKRNTTQGVRNVGSGKAAGLDKAGTLRSEIETLTQKLNEDFSLSGAQQYALKKKLALKRASLIRLERKLKLEEQEGNY